jgi:N utilization substance protein B
MIEFYKDKDIKSDYEIDKLSKLKLKPSYNYLNELVKSTHENIEEIDKIVEKHLTNEWSLQSLPKLLFATLRVAVCELKYFPETPSKVIINEYTDISSDMLDTGEVGFVNSVLDKYASDCR